MATSESNPDNFATFRADLIRIKISPAVEQVQLETQLGRDRKHANVTSADDRNASHSYLPVSCEASVKLLLERYCEETRSRGLVTRAAPRRRLCGCRASGDRRMSRPDALLLSPETNAAQTSSRAHTSASLLFESCATPRSTHTA